MESESQRQRLLCDITHAICAKHMFLIIYDVTSYMPIAPSYTTAKTMIDLAMKETETTGPPQSPANNTRHRQHLLFQKRVWKNKQEASRQISNIFENKNEQKKRRQLQPPDFSIIKLFESFGPRKLLSSKTCVALKYKNLELFGSEPSWIQSEQSETNLCEMSLGHQADGSWKH